MQFARWLLTIHDNPAFPYRISTEHAYLLLHDASPQQNMALIHQLAHYIITDAEDDNFTLDAALIVVHSYSNQPRPPLTAEWAELLRNALLAFHNDLPKVLAAQAIINRADVLPAT